MTDAPRFQRVRAAPDGAHRHYHGGRLVDLALAIADLWKAYAHEVQGSHITDLCTSPNAPGRHASLTHKGL
jgi:hypothetical protein